MFEPHEFFEDDEGRPCSFFHLNITKKWQIVAILIFALAFESFFLAGSVCMWIEFPQGKLKYNAENVKPVLILYILTVLLPGFLAKVLVCFKVRS